MKYLYLLLLSILILSSCGKDDFESDNRDCRNVEYNTEIDIKLNDKVCFPDGNTLTLTDIKHQFCPCFACCIWAGDLYITLTTSTGSAINYKKFYPANLGKDRSIFINHEITTLSYSYGNEVEDVPDCSEDFDPEKTVLTFRISKL